MLKLPVGGVWGGANGLTHRELLFKERINNRDSLFLHLPSV